MLGGLFDADLLSGKHLTEIDLAPLVADAAAAGDDGGPVVKRIIEFLEAAIGAGRRRVTARRRGHVEGLVRPFVVVALHEGVEAHLLVQHVRGRGTRGVGLEGEVHALVAAVLLGMTGRDALEANPEP